MSDENTPSIPGVSRYALVVEIHRALASEYGSMDCWSAADAALAYIATHQEPVTCICGAEYDGCPQCAADDAYEKGRKNAACDRDHADEWVEVDGAVWEGLPDGTRLRHEWVRGRSLAESRNFVHRDDLPDPDADLVERMARAIFASDFPSDRWDDLPKGAQDPYRKVARAALAASREMKETP